jgi:hypothetical protein
LKKGTFSFSGFKDTARRSPEKVDVPFFNGLPAMQDAAWKSCGLAAWGVVRIPWTEIADRRRVPGRSEGLKSLAPLKLADEQTVVALAAILSACDRAGWKPNSFGDWGILAAPRYIGRTRFAQALGRFQKLGIRGVSPLLIPTLSQHSVSGTLSLILGCHGPSFGVGSGSTAVGEILIDSMSLFEGQPCPGMWAVLTEWDPEPLPDRAGQILNAPVGIGVALALTPEPAAGEIRLAGRGTPTRLCDEPLVELASFFESPENQTGWRHAIRGGGFVEVIPTKAPVSPQSVRQAA